MVFRTFTLYLVLSCLACKNAGDSEKNKGNVAASGSTTPLVLTLETFADSLMSPVAMEAPRDGSGRVFYAEQGGRIMIIDKSGAVNPVPFLDIRKSLVSMEDKYMDVGILGFAFHPHYKSNGRFFVHYSAPSIKKGLDHFSVLKEFHVSAKDPDLADPQGTLLLQVPQPEQNHNGGNIVFDATGLLYLGFGDGGGQGDQHGKIGNGQDLNTLLGKIIRIDIDHGKPYRVPEDNPFVGREGRDEIFCYGLRMPWRISFDKKTGELFCGDVGQNAFEEVNLIEKGKNYGWRAMEGFHPYDSTLLKHGQDFTAPLVEYKHPEGLSITGGYVYRGKKHPELEGKYIFGDWAFKIFYLEKDSSGKWARRVPVIAGMKETLPFRVNSFGEDENGEIYVVTQSVVGAINPSGVLYRIGVAPK